MLRFVVRRLLIAIPTVFFISVVAFAIIQLPPGDYLTTVVAQSSGYGQAADPAQIQAVRERYGIDAPLYVQFEKWIVPILFEADFGRSFRAPEKDRRWRAGSRHPACYAGERDRWRTAMAKIGFLGLGKMGSGMASHLVAAGDEVTVWNRSPDKIGALTARGARAATTPADAAADADAIVSMVADDEASARVWLADDGAFSAARPGTLAIECSTVSHGHVLRLASEAQARGLVYIDSPVNGPPRAAAEGKLILLVGAAPDDLARAKPILETLASSILHFGAVGTGTTFKLLNNLLGAVHIASLAEAVSLANKLGLDRETLIAAIESGPCASPHVTRLARPMVEGEISPRPALSIGLREKDARYCLGLARDAEMGMSVGEVAHRWYRLASESLAQADDSALIQSVRAHVRHARVEVSS